MKPEILLLALIILSSCSQHKVKRNQNYYFYHTTPQWIAVKDLDPVLLESNPVQRKIRLYSDTEWKYVFETDLQTLENLLSNDGIKVQCSEKDKLQISDYRWNHDKLQTQCDRKTDNQWKTVKLNQLKLIQVPTAKSEELKND